jgi:ribosomal protein S18 acetylase RimI-like enzyme
MTLKKATLQDIKALKKICTDAYAGNFYHHWNENGLEWYLEKEFGDERLKADLSNRNVAYYFIEYRENPVGFVKISYNTEINNLQNEAVELEKIYVLPEFKGKGLGKASLGEIVESLKKQGIKTLFLCVIDTNINAIAFYKKLGFTINGTTRLDLPYFKEELKGMYLMVLELTKQSANFNLNPNLHPTQNNP